MTSSSGPSLSKTLPFTRRDEHVVVGEHHALRAAGRARGVEDDGEVGALAGATAASQLATARPDPQRVRSRPSCLHVVDRFQPRVVVVAQAARLVIDDVLEPGQPLRIDSILSTCS